MQKISNTDRLNVELMTNVIQPITAKLLISLYGEPTNSCSFLDEIVLM